MSNTITKHDSVHKEKMEEQTRLATVILFVSIAVLIAYTIVGFKPSSDVTFVPAPNGKVSASLAQNRALDIKEVGHEGDKIQIKIKNFDKRKKYILDLGDGKVVTMKKDIIEHKYSENGFFTINLVESNHGRLKELFNNTITITTGI